MRRLTSLVVSVAVGFASVLVIPANPAGAAQTGDTPETDGSDVLITRYGGADRYATSLLIAEAVAAEAGGSLEWVVLVSGERWTDAVVAAPVAGTLGAPVLMSPPGELRPDAAEFLQRTGVSNALVVGPDASGGAHGPGRGVAPAVLEALEDAGVSAGRVAGDDRYSTGVAAAGRVTPGVMPGLGRTVIVASGEVFADALVAGPFAARFGHPVLLTPPGELHADVAGYLTANSIEHVVLMGGTAALSEAVESSITDLGAGVRRLAGATRYDTAVKAAELVADRYSAAAGRTCFATSTIGVARARVPFDSFSAAPLLSRLCAPLVLADPAQIPADTAAYLDAAREANPMVDLRIFGGDAAVSQAAIDAYISGEEPAGDESAEDEPAEDSAEHEPASSVLPAGTCGGSIDDEPRQLVPSRNAEDPAWSPDCSQLVYVQSRELWLMDNDGTNRHRIVPYDGGYVNSPEWSPDGTEIVFVRGFGVEDGWIGHIWKVNADGSGKEKLTHNDVRDEAPRWSPDSETIVFSRHADGDRYIARMNRAGKKEKALTPGGSWDYTPAWSPDGTRLAYNSGGTIVIAKADGSDPEPVIFDVSAYGGLSWSPDGKRLAFARAASLEEQIFIADASGLNEEIVFVYQGHLRAPRWSPDGQLLAFHTIGGDSSHLVYVAGARGESVQTAGCAPEHFAHGIPGFGSWDVLAASTGTLRIAVFFVDFDDAQATHTTQEEASSSLEYAETYLEAMSYGALDVEFVVLHQWLRAPHTVEENLQSHGDHLFEADGEVTSHAVELAADSIDFSTIDDVLLVFPSTHFEGGNTVDPVEIESANVPVAWVNTFPRPDPIERRLWGGVAAHELAHNLGLLDLYFYGDTALPEPPEGKTWVSDEWGLMLMNVHYLADEDHPGIEATEQQPGASPTTWPYPWLGPREMFAWHRWLLGWLDESQVDCVTQDSVTTYLSPIADPGSGTAMAAIRLHQNEVLVLESRREQGYDADRQVPHPHGWPSTEPRLIEEGVLVYTVSAHPSLNRLPVRFAADPEGTQLLDSDPILAVGESITVRGYTITVTADDGDTHTVTITRTD
ncbi:cell wall-binding repeat-containing protein [Candidatus Poriferisodalis sp.]|uniref:cell wall-binding repeat-containing protein n=1 Tax=Candidatus Poriferisodalis sp. TaxID=3101277 RepID=UPI003B0282B8